MKRKTTTFTEAEKKILSQLETLVQLQGANASYIRSKAYPDLTLSQIQRICAEAWGVSEAEIIGRVNHADHLEKERKTSFLCACIWFSNKNSMEVAEFMNCTWYLVRNSRDKLYYKIIYPKESTAIYLEIFKNLSKECPGRLDRFISDLAAVDEANNNEIARQNAVQSNGKKNRPYSRMLEISERILQFTKANNFSQEYFDLLDEMKHLCDPPTSICSSCRFNKVCPFTDSEASQNHYLYCPKTGEGQRSKYSYLFVNDVKLKKLKRAHLN